MHEEMRNILVDLNEFRRTVIWVILHYIDAVIIRLRVG